MLWRLSASHSWKKEKKAQLLITKNLKNLSIIDNEFVFFTWFNFQIPSNSTVKSYSVNARFMHMYMALQLVFNRLNIQKAM